MVSKSKINEIHRRNRRNILYKNKIRYKLLYLRLRRTSRLYKGCKGKRKRRAVF